MTASRRTLLSDGVPIACRDHGGSGRDLVLMHGAGMTQVSLEPLIAELRADFRVISFDFRGHGDTPAACWTLDDAVGDLEAVIAGFGLERPVVAGHSLGGMVAALFAERHADSGPAINLDGQGMGSPADYPGKDPVAVAAWIAGMQARSARVIKLLRLMPRWVGPRRADVATMLAITESVDALDLFEVYRRVLGPLLIVNASAAPTGHAAKLLKDPDDFYPAYRRGIRRNLASLAESHPNVKGFEMDASHMLIRTHPAETAAIMRNFVRAGEFRAA